MEPARDTIRIQHDGFPDGLVINADEFDASVHTLFGEKGKEPSTAAKSAPPSKGKSK